MVIRICFKSRINFTFLFVFYVRVFIFICSLNLFLHLEGFIVNLLSGCNEFYGCVRYKNCIAFLKYFCKFGS